MKAADDDAIRPIVVVRVKNNESSVERDIYAMLDSGSDRDVICSKLVDEMMLSTISRPMTINTVDSSETRHRSLASFTIGSIGGNYSAPVEEAIVSDLRTSASDVPPSQRDMSMWPHLGGITFHSTLGGVQMILGVSHTVAMLNRQTRVGLKNHPIGVKTDFGWTILGSGGGPSSGTFSSCLIQSSTAEIRENIDRIFFHDFPPVSSEEIGESRENAEAIRQIRDSIRFDDKVGKYFSALPWKRGRKEATRVLNAVDSRSMALRRLKGMIPRFRRDLPRKARIFSEVRKFDEKGHAIDVNDVDHPLDPEKPHWHLPLHVVEKKGKTRVCHDARASVGGTCLNEELLGGPNLMNSLSKILHNFRAEPIAFMTDIAAFFHNIFVDERDADVFRYFFFADESMDRIEEKRFKGHIFGSAASSVVTSYVIRHHAQKIRSRYPKEIYDLLRHFIYVDDLSGGDRTVEGALEQKRLLEMAMDEAGFTLSKWKSNAPELFDETPDMSIQQLVNEITKVLGVGWDPKNDKFVFIFNPSKAGQPIKTPRELVSAQAEIWDPLGWIAPFIWLARKMLQLAMKNNRGWDSPLDPKLRTEFEAWVKSIALLVHLSIPRWWACHATIDSSKIELHIFCDASGAGFGCVSYRVVRAPSGVFVITILEGRACVVPLNSARASHHNSIPRLELVAAVKAVQMRKSIEAATGGRFAETFLWTDSEAVLKQIFDRSSHFPVFVANRLSEIHASSTIEEWNYVESGQNPADLCSRGIQAHETEKWKFYHNGPNFLRLPRSEWPIMKVSRHPKRHDAFGAINIAAASTGSSSEPPVPFFANIAEKVSGWGRKLRRIASVIVLAKRWIHIWRNSSSAASKNSGAEQKWVFHTSNDDVQSAKLLLFKDIQRSAFPKEMEDLHAHRVTLPDARKEVTTKASKIGSLNPFVDAEGIIRSGGRLKNAPMDAATRFPIILPRKNTHVRDLIRAQHLVNLHAGPKYVLTQLRQTVWILQGMQEVKSVVTKCIQCQKAFKKPLEQKMAALPASRVTPGVPFESTGLDLMGPFGVKMNGRATHKVWVAIFTCFTTRSVHAEMVHKMDADSLINAIVRFAARRPGIKRFFSDRGTNLTAADRILRDELEVWNRSSTADLQRRGLEWSFIPASTPHYGGVWERVVGLFKRHLATQMSKEPLQVDALNSLVVEIEGIINKRPLSELSADPRDLDPITPAHLLYPDVYAHSSSIIVPVTSSSPADNIRSSWKRVQARVDDFWRIWSKEYVTLLHKRTKWTKTRREMRNDDLVLIVTKNLPRCEWPMGRVVNVYDEEGLVRKADILRKDGKVIHCDRTNVVLLEMDDEEKIALL